MLIYEKTYYKYLEGKVQNFAKGYKMSLTEFLQQLQLLTYDDLIDLIDLVEDGFMGVKKVSSRRRGKTPLDKIILTGSSKSAYQLFAGLKAPDRRAGLIVAKALRDTKNLKTKKRRKADGQALAKGSIVLKTVRRMVMVSKDPVRFDWVYFGPYLYLRLWATGGEYDPVRREYQKRLKSYYIGGNSTGGKRDKSPYPYKLLAEALQALKDDKEAYQDLANRVLGCIDLSRDQPIIDHEALLELQAML